MKVRLFLGTNALEQIAKGETPSSVDAFPEGSYYYDSPGPERTPLGEFEVALPSRDAAVNEAVKQLHLARAGMDAYFKKRLAELQAITWESPR